MKLCVEWSLQTVCVFLQPLMREVIEKKADITKQEARDLVERCLKVLYYRDARSYNRVSFDSRFKHKTLNSLVLQAVHIILCLLICLLD